jgi:hypothetical protein
MHAPQLPHKVVWDSITRLQPAITVFPFAMNCRQNSRPMPRLAPVTTIVFPVMTGIPLVQSPLDSPRTIVAMKKEEEEEEEEETLKAWL